MPQDLVLEASKLLKELEEKALKNITATIKSTNNSIQFDGFATSRSSLISNSIEWRISIFLNGQETLISDEIEISNAYDQFILRGIIARSVANKIMEYIDPYISFEVKKIGVI